MNLNDITRKLINDSVSDLHTALPAKIEKVDLQTMRAEITLLNQKELEDEMVTIPPIVEVPISYYRANNMIMRPPYQKGDTVLVVFAENALDKLMITGQPEDPELTRRHSIDDAIIVGGLQMEQDDDLPSNYADQMVIGLLNGSDFDSWIRIDPNTREVEIKLKNDAFIRIEEGVATVEAETVKLGKDASEAVALGDSLKQWLDEHTHPGVSSGSSSTSPPASPSPDPSKKVMTE